MGGGAAAASGALDAPRVEVAERWEGATAPDLAGRWRVPRVALFRTVGSTNDVARALGSAGAPTWSVVLAEEQLAGRGRAGREWSSPPGVGIWISLLLRERVAEELPLLPLRVGLAAARALDGYAGGRTIRVKWPNDLLLDGRKLAGILAEAVWDGGRPAVVVVGIGINVGQTEADFPAALRAGATSLRIATGNAPPRVDVATALLHELRAGLASRASRLDADALAELATRDALRGRRVEVTGAGAPLRGTACGIGSDGALRIRTDSGVERLARSGSVLGLEETAPAGSAAMG